MLTKYGVPLLRELHLTTFEALQYLGRFEDYLYRWRVLLGDLAEGMCPCGCLDEADTEGE